MKNIPIQKGTPSPELYDHKDNENICFLCGNPRYKHYLTINEYGFQFEYKRCQCGIIKQVPMPNEAFFEWFFNSEYFFSSETTKDKKIWGYHDYFADEANRMSTSKWRYRRLKKFFDAGHSLNVMKIGPSTGTFLHIAQQNGHHCRGCDVSNRFRQYAMEHYDVTIDYGRFEKQGYDNEQFDRLLLLSVLENVPNQDEFLREIQRTVKIQEFFIFNYVDMKYNLVEKLQKQKYSLYRPPICYLYDHEVITKLLNKYGFVEVYNIADLRVMNIEKILTLFGWHRIWKVAKALHINRISFPIYAYPSRIIVAQRVR